MAQCCLVLLGVLSYPGLGSSTMATAIPQLRPPGRGRCSKGLPLLKPSVRQGQDRAESWLFLLELAQFSIPTPTPARDTGPWVCWDRQQF